ncbi:GTP-binding protein [Dehalobacter sp. DCM]|uniref:CobW family GTP-binding protein n=1 Tax=Dehalobacter sp. DCM TaxID=2907827 RepID=UPI0030813328|nr:GTP-binding protein [Dehalobacter sp. DCM]
MIKIILLTGFLGSGKTTLLERLLQHFDDTPIGLIVNEFGEINIDARLIEKDGIPMSELSNGSIFCACIKENFVKAIIKMSSREIEYLLIEASGLADPSSMGQILQAIKAETVHPCRYCGSLCVLDGEAFLELESVLPAVRKQLTYAGAAIVNKEDLINDEVKSKILNVVKTVNPNVPIYFTSYCNLDIAQLFRQIKPSEVTSKASSNTPENRPQTFILKILNHITLDELQGFLKFIAPYTYRIKGFAKVGDTDYTVSGVRSHMLILPWPGKTSCSEIVLISSVGIGITSVIANGIKRYAPLAIKL